jgi:hypothetical protein
MVRNDTTILSERIDRKHELLVQLRDIGLRQLELIASGDMNQLLRVLQTVERSLDPFRGDDPERRIWKSAVNRQQCAQKAEQCEALLRIIVEQERESESQMIVRRNETARRIREIQHAADIHRAYSDESAPLAGQLDLSQG